MEDVGLAPAAGAEATTVRAFGVRVVRMCGKVGEAPLQSSGPQGTKSKQGVADEESYATQPVVCGAQLECGLTISGVRNALLVLLPTSS